MINALKFMTPVLRLALLACTSLCLLRGHAPGADERQFLMGLAPMNFDESPAGTERMKAGLAKNAEVVAVYLDWGVPWPEAFEGQPFHENVRKEIAAARQRISPQHQVFLALTAGAFNRREMAGYWGEKTQMPRPGRWADKGLDDPDVITAFGNYCERMIAEFQPTFLCYAIEINMMAGPIRTSAGTRRRRCPPGGFPMCASSRRIRCSSSPKSVKLTEPTEEKVQKLADRLLDAGIEVRGKTLREVKLPVSNA